MSTLREAAKVFEQAFLDAQAEGFTRDGARGQARQKAWETYKAVCEAEGSKPGPYLAFARALEGALEAQ